MLAALLLAGGCWRDPTEIVIVVDTDLTPNVDFNNLFIQLENCFFTQCAATAFTLPATLGVVPPSSGVPPGFEAGFGVTVSTTVGVTGMFGSSSGPSVTRGASGLQFVSDEIRALFLPLYRKCQCQGTTCPNLADPDCADLNEPALSSFDEDQLPRIGAPTMTTATATMTATASP